MTTIPDPRPPEDEDPRHPDWCNPDRCLSGDPRRSDHRSLPVVIDPVQPFDPTIAAWIEQFANEPIETAPRFVSLRLTYRDLRGEVTDVTGFHLWSPQAIALGRALIDLGERAGMPADEQPEAGS